MDGEGVESSTHTRPRQNPSIFLRYGFTVPYVLRKVDGTPERLLFLDPSIYPCGQDDVPNLRWQLPILPLSFLISGLAGMFHCF